MIGRFTHNASGQVYTLDGYGKVKIDGEWSRVLWAFYQRNGERFARPAKEFEARFTKLDDDKPTCSCINGCKSATCDKI